MKTTGIPVETAVSKKVETIGFSGPPPWVGQMPDGRVLTSPPQASMFKNSILVKGGSKRYGTGHVMYGGAYDDLNEPIKNVDVVRGPTETVFLRKPLNEVNFRDLKNEERPVCLIGWNFGHFGHFITETLSNCWLLQFLSDDISHVYISPFNSDFSKNEIELLKLAGLRARMPEGVQSDTLYSTLLSPEPMFRPRRYAYKAMGEFYRTIGERILSDISVPEKIFVSRKNLKQFTRAISNEVELEFKLNELGFVSISPENLSISEQVTIFKRAKIIVGLSGSFFHLAPIAASNAKRICLSGNIVNGNFILTDALSEGTSLYVNCLSLESNSEGRNLKCDINSAMKAILEA